MKKFDFDLPFTVPESNITYHINLPNKPEYITHDKTVIYKDFATNQEKTDNIIYKIDDNEYSSTCRANNRMVKYIK